MRFAFMRDNMDHILNSNKKNAQKEITNTYGRSKLNQVRLNKK